MKRFAALLITIFMITGSAYASGVAEKFSLDRIHTYVGFNVSYLVLARVNGQFNNFKGSFIIDAKTPDNSQADIVIQTSSVDTGYAARDSDIRGTNFFDADRYPTMVFHSRAIEMVSEEMGHITGDLTLLGITKPVTLSFTKMPRQDDSLAGGYKVTGQIKRSDFGMNAFIPPIGNVVTLLICYNMQECSAEEAPPDKYKRQYNE